MSRKVVIYLPICESVPPAPSGTYLHHKINLKIYKTRHSQSYDRRSPKRRDSADLHKVTGKLVRVGVHVRG